VTHLTLAAKHGDKIVIGPT